MKKFKRILSIVLAMTMVLAMGMTAFASTLPTSTVNTATKKDQAVFKIEISNDKTGHTYSAYQIFNGDVNTDGKLSNVEWGTNIDKTKLPAKYTTKQDGSAMTVQEAMEAVTDANAFYKELKEAGAITGDPAGTATAPADGKYTIGSLKPGYYAVVDANANTDDFESAIIVSVVGNVTAKPKGDKPGDDKLVQDLPADMDTDGDSSIADSENTTGYGKTSDQDINKSFKFRLTATIPADTNVPEYDRYDLTFVDEMSAGITFEEMVSVKIRSANGTWIVVNEGTTDGTYNTDAVANKAGGTFKVNILDIKKIAGLDLTKAIEVEVLYKVHLNENCDVTAPTEDTTTNMNKSHIEFTNKLDGTGKGKTEDKPTYVFTYEIDNTKFDGDPKADKSNILAGAGFKLYKADGETEIPVIKITSGENAGKYRPATSTETGEEMFSANGTGKFDLCGLDVGTYVIKETTTPAGYNTCAPITVVISAEHNVQNGTPKVNLEQSSNLVNEVVNKQGAELPSTGGMGTTIFYIVGAMLAVGAAVILVTKKRMNG